MFTLKISQARLGLELPPWLVQALKFAVVGVLNTALDAGVYLMLTRWLGLAALPVLAKGISYGVGTLNSFAWNRSWTFKSEAGVVTTLASFVFANLVALAVNAGTMHLCVNVVHLDELLSLALATGVTLLWNFAISKFLIFKK